MKAKSLIIGTFSYKRAKRNPSFSPDAVKRFIVSNKCSLWVSLFGDQNINIRESMIKLQRGQHLFSFSYFFYSKLSREMDWLSAISRRQTESSTRHHNRHTPGMADWSNVYHAVAFASSKVFLIVIDNASNEQKFTKMQYRLIKNLMSHQKYLMTSFKFLFIKRIRQNLSINP